ncbi:hypothetical protein NDU88_005116 [Pleurodeles waltl]|uniref:Uncharacterized protein n=1 Tax=Pleurodeles waltl TaxID=8319 RepID=A0AAV7L3W8_PLEWA|nr:hypothetical protein NDU88_005116 [Pleurodeles waltl]
MMLHTRVSEVRGVTRSSQNSGISDAQAPSIPPGTCFQKRTSRVGVNDIHLPNSQTPSPAVANVTGRGDLPREERAESLEEMVGTQGRVRANLMQRDAFQSCWVSYA